MHINMLHLCQETRQGCYYPCSMCRSIIIRVSPKSGTTGFYDMVALQEWINIHSFGDPVLGNFIVAKPRKFTLNLTGSVQIPWSDIKINITRLLQMFHLMRKGLYIGYLRGH